MNSNIFLLWLPMIVIAFANALLREKIFIQYFDEARAHQFSTCTLIILCAIYTWFVFPRLHVQSPKQAFIIGTVWVLLTVAFEFALGRLTNKSWEYLFRDYNILAGRIWLIFLVVLFFLPFLIYSLKKN
ncbi:MAG: hypothetical protein EOO01_16685 [Chitinophagaceae bacterium]|nr:MAG: hypothetical protein EOO01_16685 [Chitinophagaceae bacterium]